MFGRCSQLGISFAQDEDGPTAVEYAVMLALIIVVCIAAITTLGHQRQQHVHQRRPSTPAAGSSRQRLG